MRDFRDVGGWVGRPWAAPLPVSDARSNQRLALASGHRRGSGSPGFRLWCFALMAISPGSVASGKDGRRWAPLPGISLTVMRGRETVRFCGGRGPPTPGDNHTTTVGGHTDPCWGWARAAPPGGSTPGPGGGIPSGVGGGRQQGRGQCRVKRSDKFPQRHGQVPTTPNVNIGFSQVCVFLQAMGVRGGREVVFGSRWPWQWGGSEGRICTSARTRASSSSRAPRSSRPSMYSRQRPAAAELRNVWRGGVRRPH